MAHHACVEMSIYNTVFFLILKLKCGRVKVLVGTFEEKALVAFFSISIVNIDVH